MVLLEHVMLFLSAEYCNSTCNHIFFITRRWPKNMLLQNLSLLWKIFLSPKIGSLDDITLLLSQVTLISLKRKRVITLSITLCSPSFHYHDKLNQSLHNLANQLIFDYSNHLLPILNMMNCMILFVLKLHFHSSMALILTNRIIIIYVKMNQLQIMTMSIMMKMMALSLIVIISFTQCRFQQSFVT